MSAKNFKPKWTTKRPGWLKKVKQEPKKES